MEFAKSKSDDVTCVTGIQPVRCLEAGIVISKLCIICIFLVTVLMTLFHVRSFRLDPMYLVKLKLFINIHAY